jgi:hypothetical protein
LENIAWLHSRISVFSFQRSATNSCRARARLRETRFATGFIHTPGGDDRIRTGDPLLAKQVLSQLSYIPALLDGGPSWDRTRDLALIKRAL